MRFLVEVAGVVGDGDSFELLKRWREDALRLSLRLRDMSDHAPEMCPSDKVYRVENSGNGCVRGGI